MLCNKSLPKSNRAFLFFKTSYIITAMPFSNIITSHITDEQTADFDNALSVLQAIASALTQNLTPEERKRFGSINEQNKLLANKVHDYHTTNPELQSPDVDWDEFERDFKTRHILETRALRMTSILKMVIDAKILHDYDNYQNSLTDYFYTKYKNSTTGGGSWSVKKDELRQLFPKS